MQQSFRQVIPSINSKAFSLHALGLPLLRSKILGATLGRPWQRTTRNDPPLRISALKAGIDFRPLLSQGQLSIWFPAETAAPNDDVQTKQLPLDACLFAWFLATASSCAVLPK